MSASLPNVATQDNYAGATTLPCPRAARVRLVVANAAIYWRRGAGEQVPSYSEPEEYLPPGVFSFDEDCDAIQVRSAVAAQPAQVSISTRTAEEISG